MGKRQAGGGFWAKTDDDVSTMENMAADKKKAQVSHVNQEGK